MTDTAGPPSVREHWRQIADSESYASLVTRRRRLVIGSLTVATIWFGLFLILTVAAEEFMQRQITTGLSVAYVLGLSQFLLVWLVTTVYIRTSEKVFEPLEVSARAAAGTSNGDLR